MSVFTLLGKNKAFPFMPLWNKSSYTSTDAGNLLAYFKASGIGFSSTSVGSPPSDPGGSWIGSVLAPNGCIYAMPYNSSNILKIDTRTDAMSLINISDSATAKWRGGVLAPNGKIYCAPYDKTGVVLVIDPSNDSFYTITTTATGRFQGGSVAFNGKIYFFPEGLTRFGLIVDPSDDSYTVTSTIGFDPGPVFGGVLATNGNIYVPLGSTANGIMKINPTTNAYTKISSTSQNYYGAALARTGYIYSWGATSVMKFDPSLETYTNIGTFTSSPHTTSILSPDGRIYAVGGAVYGINPDDDSTVTPGTSFSSISGSNVGADGCVWLIPNSSGGTVYKISYPAFFGVPKDFYLSRHYNKL